MSEIDKCEICTSNNWTVIYEGNVRDGAFGQYLSEAGKVFQCNQCGAQRLRESDCADESIYEDSEYRKLLNESLSVSGFFEEHDILQIQHLNEIWPVSLRNKTIADVGCAAGSFIDHVRGLADNVIAIEPCEMYHNSLAERGCNVYSSITEAATKFAGKVDFIFSFSVIEHVNNPKIFLEEIKELLAPNGKILISTPNRKDLLMELLPKDYPSFFYRKVHRWYFDSASFQKCAGIAGLKVLDLKFVHRFSLANTLNWLKEKKPKGYKKIEFLSDDALDRVWKTTLEKSEKTDYLYLYLQSR